MSLKNQSQLLVQDFPPDLKAEFKAECARKGVKMKHMLPQLIREWLRRKQRRTPKTEQPAGTA